MTRKNDEQPLQSLKDVFFNSKLSPAAVLAILALISVLLMSIQSNKNTLKQEMVAACKDKDREQNSNPRSLKTAHDLCQSKFAHYWDAPGINN